MSGTFAKKIGVFWLMERPVLIVAPSILKVATPVGANYNIFGLSGEPEWNENVLIKYEVIVLAK